MNNSFDSIQLLVLVPHRDARGLLRAWSGSLFSEGLPGAWSFPWVTPIAALKRPLSNEELKSRALALRQIIEHSGGKIISGPSEAAVISNNVSVFGPSVNIALPDSFFDFNDDAVIRRVSSLVVGAALCETGSTPNVSRPAPVLSFRAAALANMVFRPLPSSNGAYNDFSFEWEIGKLFWLPKC